MKSSAVQTTNWLVFVTAFALMVSEHSAFAQARRYSAESISSLNGLFRKEYAAARQSQLKGVSPVIIVRGDNLVMLRNGRRYVGSSVNANYHDLKAIAHIPLGLFCIVENCLDKPLTADGSKRLQRFKAALVKVRGDLAGIFNSPKQRAPQSQLIDRCLKFADATLETGRCSFDKLDGLLGELRPTIVNNARRAAQIRIDNYHEQLKSWHRLLSVQEWDRMFVVIPGAVMSRKNSLAVRYFAKLFEQPGEGGRVIYAESQFDESKDLQLLGTHILDSRIGKVFFDDTSRMKRDLLGPAANTYLDSLDFGEFRTASKKKVP